MKLQGLLPAAPLLFLLLAACATTRDYSSKIFGPQAEPGRDSVAPAPRFLEMEKINSRDAGWVDAKPFRDSVLGKDAGVVAAGAPPDTAAATRPVAKTHPVSGTRDKRSREE